MIEKILNNDQYFKEKTLKTQIVLHHTAGGGNAENVIHGWNFNQERVATAFVIDSKGEVFKAFEPEFWAYHLGLKTNFNVPLNKGSIGIEVCNWGQLIKKGNEFYNYVNKVVPENEVVQIKKFRGFEYYHKYNDAQIESLRKLLLELCAKFGISKRYNSDMWDISKNALGGFNGIYTHVSYRIDKNDMSPQINLIEMLKILKE
jgi:N-acetyl-anhydromuramyl-L-alanine amidase AmpD